jgi:spoIIIJ-associated protein
MDWVETTGSTVEEASQRALDHLGVGSSDADIEILEEPTTGIFGRRRGEARVRARIRPATPRPKRTRHGSSRSEGRPREGRSSEGRSSEGRTRQGRPEGNRDRSESSDVRTSPSGQGHSRSARRRQNRAAASGGAETVQRPPKEDTMAEGMTLAEQGEIAKGFLVGLLAAMNLEAEVTTKELDEETIEISVDATPPTELGVLVGPRGTTLQALQEVTRTVVQAKCPSRTDRILVDVAHYRERRVAALGRFATQVASEVQETGEERALEPMSAADRKAVHDALTDLEGVTTRSEGEEPRRFVVVAPA